MVVVRAVGDSMEPKIHDGDLCVVRKIGAVDYDNRSLNRDYRDIEIENRDDIKIVAELKTILRP